MFSIPRKSAPSSAVAVAKVRRRPTTSTSTSSSTSTSTSTTFSSLVSSEFPSSSSSSLSSSSHNYVNNNNNNELDDKKLVSQIPQPWLMYSSMFLLRNNNNSKESTARSLIKRFGIIDTFCDLVPLQLRQSILILSNSNNNNKHNRNFHSVQNNLEKTSSLSSSLSHSDSETTRKERNSTLATLLQVSTTNNNNNNSSNRITQQHHHLQEESEVLQFENENDKNIYSKRTQESAQELIQQWIHENYNSNTNGNTNTNSNNSISDDVDAENKNRVINVNNNRNITVQKTQEALSSLPPYCWHLILLSERKKQHRLKEEEENYFLVNLILKKNNKNRNKNHNTIQNWRGLFLAMLANPAWEGQGISSFMEAHTQLLICLKLTAKFWRNSSSSKSQHHQQHQNCPIFHSFIFKARHLYEKIGKPDLFLDLIETSAESCFVPVNQLVRLGKQELLLLLEKRSNNNNNNNPTTTITNTNNNEKQQEFDDEEESEETEHDYNYKLSLTEYCRHLRDVSSPAMSIPADFLAFFITAPSRRNVADADLLSPQDRWHLSRRGLVVALCLMSHQLKMNNNDNVEQYWEQCIKCACDASVFTATDDAEFDVMKNWLLSNTKNENGNNNFEPDPNCLSLRFVEVYDTVLSVCQVLFTSSSKHTENKKNILLAKSLSLVLKYFLEAIETRLRVIRYKSNAVVTSLNLLINLNCVVVATNTNTNNNIVVASSSSSSSSSNNNHNCNSNLSFLIKKISSGSCYGKDILKEIFLLSEEEEENISVKNNNNNTFYQEMIPSFVQLTERIIDGVLLLRTTNSSQNNSSSLQQQNSVENSTISRISLVVLTLGEILVKILFPSSRNNNNNEKQKNNGDDSQDNFDQQEQERKYRLQVAITTLLGHSSIRNKLSSFTPSSQQILNESYEKIILTLLELFCDVQNFSTTTSTTSNNNISKEHHQGNSTTKNVSNYFQQARKKVFQSAIWNCGCGAAIHWPARFCLNCCSGGKLLQSSSSSTTSRNNNNNNNMLPTNNNHLEEENDGNLSQLNNSNSTSSSSSSSSPCLVTCSNCSFQIPIRNISSSSTVTQRCPCCSVPHPADEAVEIASCSLKIFDSSSVESNSATNPKTTTTTSSNSKTKNTSSTTTSTTSTKPLLWECINPTCLGQLCLINEPCPKCHRENPHALQPCHRCGFLNDSNSSHSRSDVVCEGCGCLRLQSRVLRQLQIERRTLLMWNCNTCGIFNLLTSDLQKKAKCSKCDARVELRKPLFDSYHDDNNNININSNNNNNNSLLILPYQQWTCGCGAQNSPTRISCIRCSNYSSTSQKYSQQPQMTCASCRHVVSVDSTQQQQQQQEERKTNNNISSSPLLPMISTPASTSLAAPWIEAIGDVSSTIRKCPHCTATHPLDILRLQRPVWALCCECEAVIPTSDILSQCTSSSSSSNNYNPISSYSSSSSSSGSFIRSLLFSNNTNNGNNTNSSSSSSSFSFSTTTTGNDKMLCDSCSFRKQQKMLMMVRKNISSFKKEKEQERNKLKQQQQSSSFSAAAAATNNNNNNDSNHQSNTDFSTLSSSSTSSRTRIAFSAVPWSCHKCGNLNEVSSLVIPPVITTAMNSSSSPPLLSSAATTTQYSENKTTAAATAGGALLCSCCGTDRLPTALFNETQEWKCSVCFNNNSNKNSNKNKNNNSDDAVGFVCSSCFSLHPQVPPTSVFSWICANATCQTLNPSWLKKCRKCKSEVRKRSSSNNDDEIISLRYQPWHCSSSSSSSSSSNNNSNNDNNDNDDNIIPKCELCAEIHSSLKCSVENETKRLDELEKQLLGLMEIEQKKNEEKSDQEKDINVIGKRSEQQQQQQQQQYYSTEEELPESYQEILKTFGSISSSSSSFVDSDATTSSSVSFL